MGVTKPRSLPLPLTRTYSHQLPPTSIYLHPLLPIPTHSQTLPSTLFTYLHSFSAISPTLTHVQPTSISLIPIPAHVQPLSSISSRYPNTPIQSNPSLTIPTHIQSLCFTCVQFYCQFIFSPVFSFVLKTTYDFRLNNYLCIFSRHFLFSKNSPTMRGIYKFVKYIFTTFCEIFTRMKIYLVYISFHNYVVIFSFWKYRSTSRIFTILGKVSQ